MVSVEQYRALVARREAAEVRAAARRRAAHGRPTDTPPRRPAVPGPPVPDRQIDALVDAPPAAAFIVYGMPAPKGSKRPIGKRTITTKVGITKQITAMVEQNKGVGPWERAIVQAWHAIAPAGWTRLNAPVILDVVYTLPRLAGSAKTLAEYPDGRGDVDKFDRATHDGMTTAGLWVDDNQLVGHRRHRAFYTGHPDPDVLPDAGAVIRVWTLPRVPLAELRQAYGL